MYTHADHIVTIDGIESRVHITHGPGVTHAHGIAFDSEARTVAETGTQRYVGYCDAEVVGIIAAKMTNDATSADTEWGSIDYALSVVGLTCNCEEGDDDDA